MARLVITSGPERGLAFELGLDQVLGRSAANAIPLKDTRASREHARVLRTDEGFLLQDLGSKNGTRHNGVPVSEARLQPGDEIVIGETWLRFEEGPGPDRAPAPPPHALVEVRHRPGKAGERALLTSKTARRHAQPTRTSLAWLRHDLSQASWLFRFLIQVGAVALALGLGYLAYRLMSGG
jgi:hypothetical protein